MVNAKQRWKLTPNQVLEKEYARELTFSFFPQSTLQFLLRSTPLPGDSQNFSKTENRQTIDYIQQVIIFWITISSLTKVPFLNKFATIQIFHWNHLSNSKQSHSKFFRNLFICLPKERSKDEEWWEEIVADFQVPKRTKGNKLFDTN